MSSLVTSTALLSAMLDPEQPEAWEKFHNLYAKWIKGQIAGRLSAAPSKQLQQEIDNLVQDIVSRTWEQFRGKRYDPQKRAHTGGFRAWLKTVVQSVTVDAVRARQRATSAAGGDSDWLAEVPDAHAVATEFEATFVEDVAERVFGEYLLECKEWQRVVLERRGLRHGNTAPKPGEQFPSLPELSAELGKTVAAISDFLTDARRTLQKRFVDTLDALDAHGLPAMAKPR
ncbi:hypothetical protein R5W24_002899 [Gemmata sp. JC717]|uniref:Sigma-70 family RNA polymerase sigma factor n=1 Tax=Gemmata algarum TaxID=2975278 RepID=A0ABU5F423_9BACT|nr:hypothetical protein [Gemmata algarum]MDY3553785.1 hypothetical protein [Gemmata algarum]MDY3562254.1 hypothetical protein [Gemmata algarum]